MRFVGFTECADASIKCCGIWVHCRGVMFGIFPNWWWANQQNKKPIRRLGVSILTPAYWYDRRILFSITIGHREFGWMRDRIDTSWRLING